MDTKSNSNNNDTIVYFADDLNFFNDSEINWYYYYYNGNSGTINVFDFLPEAFINARIFLYRYLVLIIWITSFLGNTLVIVVLSKKRSRGFSTSVYLKGLAFADLSLNTSNTLTLYLTSHGYIKQASSDIDCKYRNVFPFAIAYITTWMLVAVSLERVISVWMPYKVKRLCTENIAYVVIVIIWILFLGLAFLHESIMFYTKGIGCSISFEYFNFYNIYLTWVLISVKFLIPYVIIFTCTVIMMFKLVNRKIRKHSTESKSRGTSVNIVLVTVNIVFLITNLPYILFYIFAKYTSFHSNPVLSFAYYYFWFTYLQVVNDCNSAVNVFVYFFVGSRFREDVKELFCRCFSKNQAGGRQMKTRDTGVSPTESEKGFSNASSLKKTPAGVMQI